MVVRKWARLLRLSLFHLNLTTRKKTRRFIFLNFLLSQLESKIPLNFSKFKQLLNSGQILVNFSSIRIRSLSVLQIQFNLLENFTSPDL